MGKPLDLLGQRFSRLLVIADAGFNKHRKKEWLCECNCHALIVATGNLLKKGSIKSCGCWNRDRILAMNKGRRKYTNDEVKSKSVWTSMMARCYKKSNIGYSNYGGAGIIVCERWHDFANFYTDMGSPPKGMSIDRIDPHGNYEPANCRWATRYEQNRNRRFHIYLEHNGKKKLLIEWAEELGVRAITLRNRKNLGWSDEDVLLTPIGPSIPDRIVMIEFQDERMCLKDWSRKLDISYNILRDRHQQGWPIEKMLTTTSRLKCCQNAVRPAGSLR